MAKAHMLPVIGHRRALPPFAMLGFDTDNDRAYVRHNFTNTLDTRSIGQPRRFVHTRRPDTMQTPLPLPAFPSRDVLRVAVTDAANTEPTAEALLAGGVNVMKITLRIAAP